MSLHSPTPGTRFGRYLIEERIGMGGMGVVFRATDTRLNRTVALKVMAGRLQGADEFTRRFEREADIMARLDSPHVITIHDHGVEDGTPWISTQFVRGGDLSDLLRATGRLPLDRAAQICAQVAGALDDAHSVGVVHRDVKPSNVLLRDRGTEPFAYLCDFGIAHAGTTGLTQTGGVAGSWAWLAPERTKGDPGAPASDIYSLGCVLWATLTGHAPYGGSDVEVALAQVQQPVPQFVGDDPATRRVNAVLSRALAKDPARRYASAADFRTDLLSLTRFGDRTFVEPTPSTPHREDTGTAVRSGTAGAPPRRHGRRRWIPVAVAVAVLAGTGTAYAVWRDDAPQDDENDPAAILGDVDGDGKGDLLVRWYNYGDSYKEGRNFLVRSTGTGFTDPERQLQPEGYLVRGDVDGDGLDDVLGINDNLETKGLDVEVITGTDDRFDAGFPRRGRRDDAFPLLADIDGDGLDDLVLTWARDSSSRDSVLEIEVALSSGDDFADPEPVATLENWTSYGEQIVAGDVDGDDRDDLVVRRDGVRPGTDAAPQLQVLLSDGSGFQTPSNPRNTPKNGVVATPLDVADVDGDGADEIVTHLRGAPGTIRVHEFEDDTISAGEDWVVDLVDDPDDPLDIAMIDVNGDGRADVVVQRAMTDTGVPFDVALSTGQSFDSPLRWGEIACLNKGCDETFSMLTNNIT
ncbi:serine/threonine-protein kinase [Nocardioides sp. Root151]|uniref:serine/threonine-protein kinase n=1 Tax=Nocardioides sp. Root151 TaxID=1736475 RepID=UPI0007037A7D|nr:protein kinase [Nocardioides sp. Root151]KQZ66778.1 hypothetical protein ASD66_17220 [Nocardioides sp. Root151]